MTNFLDQFDPDTHYYDDLYSSNQCSNFTCDEFNATFSSSSNLIIMHLNIRSLNANWDELTGYLDSLKIKFSVIIITETWLDSCSLHYNLPGYKAFHTIRHSGRGGGVSIFIDQSIHSEGIQPISSIFLNCEISAVKLKLSNQIINIIGVYRPPGGCLNDFNNEFFEMIESYCTRHKCIIAGDFNVNLASDHPAESETVFIENFQSLHFIPTINCTTRPSGIGGSIIDHIWYNSLEVYQSGVLQVEISDHFPVFIHIPIVVEKSSGIFCKFRSLTEENILNFIFEVYAFVEEFPNVGDINYLTNLLTENLYRIYNNNIPIVSKFVGQKRLKNPWITPSILDAIQRKHRLAELARNDINRLQEYRQFRNTLSQTIRLSKTNYFHSKFNSCINDAKKTWVEINKIIKGNSSKSRTIKLNDDSGEGLPPNEIPNFMNNYFFKVPLDLQSRISPSPNNPLMYISRVQNSFVFLETSADEVECIISSFKSKRSGLFDIPNFIYKRISTVISPIISKLINLSAETGVFPDIFKIAKIVPIFKSGVSTTIKNYRPISILHFISKIFEKIFHKRFISFFTKFKIINIHQYGFLKNHSTTDAAIYLTENIYRNRQNS